MSIGLLQKNIYEVAKKHNLPNNQKITKTLISLRITTDEHHVPYGQGNGFPSLFLKIEDEFLNLIISMSKCHHPIRVSNTLQLINDLITNTEYQMRLNSFKNKCCGVTEENGKAMVRKGYWSCFMKHNRNMLNITRPQKFEFDRTNWCKYTEFYDIYD